MRIAIVHDWLVTFAGAERVLQELILLFPDADLYALVDFLSDQDRAHLSNKMTNTSFLQRLPGAKKHYRSFLPLMPLAVESLDLRKYDLVISSSHAVAKGVITGPDTLHIAYIHSPPRYAWDLQGQYLSETGLGRGVKGLLVRGILHYLRLWDFAAGQRPDLIVANSGYIARRIQKAYKREASVVYPPVDVERFALRREKENFYLTVSRLVPYKRVDLVVDAFSRMPDKKLVVIGDGPEMSKVKAAARGASNITFLGYQPFEVLKEHIERAKGFVFAAEEDFGIVVVEAMAAGTPVIAYGRGGATETVKDGVTGVLFPEQSVESLVEAVRRFEEGVFISQVIRSHAENFSTTRFREEFHRLVKDAWSDFRGSSLL